MNNDEANKTQTGQSKSQPQKQDEQNRNIVDQANPEQLNQKKVIAQQQNISPQTQQTQKIKNNPDNKVIQRQDQQIKQELSEIGDQSRKQPCIDVIQEIQQLNLQVENQKAQQQRQNDQLQLLFQTLIQNTQTDHQLVNLKQFNCQFNQPSSLENHQNFCKQEFYKPQSYNQQQIQNNLNQDKSLFLNQKQSQSNFCKISGHQQKVIEFVCIYPGCSLSRFVCSKCLKAGNHKHKQQDQSHILDDKELYGLLKEKLKNRQSEQSQNIIEKFAKLKNTLHQKIIIEMHKMIKLIRGMIEMMDQDIEQLLNFKQLNESLIKLKNEGFQTLDEKYLKIMINIDKPVDYIFTQIQNQSNRLIQNTTKIQQLCQSFKLCNSESYNKIINAKNILIAQDLVSDDNLILSSSISGDFKYIVSGGQEKKLKIWNYDNKLIKIIQLDNLISSTKFTDDSTLLYVTQAQYLCQFDIDKQFKESYKSAIHSKPILNIYCITNTIILTSSIDRSIIKTDIIKRQQLLQIKAHENRIDGLDYHQNLNLIASSSDDKYIKLWNANTGQLVLQKQNAHNNDSSISQVLFIINENQLISSDYAKNVIIWNLNYNAKQLQQYFIIKEDSSINNISLVLKNYITLICDQSIKIYSIKGDFVRQFNHDVRKLSICNIVQPKTMKALLIQGINVLQICKFDFD